jgi:hypothetical protein
MNKSGAATNNIPTHVAAGIELESEIIPVMIAPTIPPMSNTIESSALASGDNGAKIKKLLALVESKKIELYSLVFLMYSGSQKRNV